VRLRGLGEGEEGEEKKTAEWIILKSIASV
jgi:hypothetical protein